ncbi:PKD domain-containing protein [Formosa sp. PL04]|uniref:PKD domain-containing protein n=1 Tax=Formosa sp. PL04 TaxID=3081755 RepID=UPI0029823753|nr:PKD domain-containing protein [Formosa sp. PL04]MDW5289166.1 PKD domain-containing protein [Formosa sp. PL04]
MKTNKNYFKQNGVRLLLLKKLGICFFISVALSSCNDDSAADPKASFSYITDDNRVVTIVNTSTGADQYYWSFGEIGAEISEVENPTYTYASDGTFTIALSAVGSEGVNQITQNVTVEEVIPPGIPIPEYKLVTDNLNSSFENLTNLNDADTFTWDFGDGNQSNDASPTHDYAEAGRYLVTFTAAGPLGAAVLLDSVFVSKELKINNGTWDDEAVKDDNRTAWRNTNLEALADAYFGDSDYFAKATSSSNHTVDGSFAANLTTNNTSTKPKRWLYQDIIVSPNSTYTITFWMKQTPDASCATYVEIYEDHFDLPEFIGVPDKIIATQSYNDSTGSSTGDWIEQSITFDTGSSSEIVLFITNDFTASEQSYYDDISIVKD